VMNPLTMLSVNQNMDLRFSHEGLDCSAQRLPRSVTEKTEEVRMSPRVAKGKLLKNGREATTSTRRDERECESQSDVICFFGCNGLRLHSDDDDVGWRGTPVGTIHSSNSFWGSGPTIQANIFGN